ncbi:MAG: hypothetical protein CMM58_04640 [Rhodospirillaceae bacterium]|nr:hypothetical protein [Rhodospirillaceae bacterium]|tara:strand:+ start:265 stop:1461 length:1197 start_codon:yes stop_codon:yes gene_type:complete
MRDSISNTDARRLFMHLHRLSDPRDKTKGCNNLPDLINSIGFAQIDSIRTVERAHHHIIFSRCQSYQREWLKIHLEKKRTLFENWTHDASIIPMAFFPYWKVRFERAHSKIISSPWWLKRIGQNADSTCRAVLNYVAENGPVKARDIKTDFNGRGVSKGNWWGWHPGKAALVFLWRTGKLAVAGRKNFEKIYDLTENVIPKKFLDIYPSEEEYLGWNCLTAMERIGFGSHSEIAKYWDGITATEAGVWCKDSKNNYIREIKIEDTMGDTYSSWAHVDIFEWLKKVPEPPGHIRFISPFDPLIRDRKRTKRLFGFDFKIEIFVPEEKREFGYYVYPILEKDRFIGRIEFKANITTGTLEVRGLWLEVGIEYTKTRKSKIEAELRRWKKFIGLKSIEWPQ